MANRLPRVAIASIAAVLVPLASLHAQRAPGSVTREVTGRFDLGLQAIGLQWRLEIAARDDGWVELLLESVPGVAPRLPWLVTSTKRRLGEPVRTRVTIRAEAAARMSAILDSTLGYRVTDVAQAVTLLELGPIPSSPSMFYAFTHQVFAPRDARPDTTASVSFVGCIAWPEASLFQQGSGLEGADISELRRLSRSIRLAAEMAGRHPVDLVRPTEVSAATAGCPARPIAGNPLPAYPGGRGDRAGTQRVELDAIVDATGRIEPASVTPVSGAAPFAQIAKETMLAWRFYPAMMAPGAPVRQRMRVEVLFAEREPRSEDEEDALLVAAGARGTDLLVIARAPASP